MPERGLNPKFYSIALDPDMILFLLTKPQPRLVGKTCQSEQRECKRPIWGDGRVDGEWYGLCSRCWHEHNAFHGHYITMQANSAAAKLGRVGIQRLTFGATLPESPTNVFPEEWL